MSHLTRLPLGGERHCGATSRLSEHPRGGAPSKRTGQRCKGPAERGWALCRMHGAGGGHKAGPTYPQWRHGGRCREVVEMRPLAMALISVRT